MLVQSNQVSSLVKSQVQSLVGVDGEFSFNKRFGTPSAAYSLRDLQNGTGTNRLVKVVRSSDDTARDFSANEISNGTLTDWVGSGNNGFVSIWYDQSGLGRDAVASDPNDEPQIVDNGTLVMVNGNPSLLFNNSLLKISDDITGEHFTVFAVVQPSQEDPSTDGYIFDNFTSYGRGLFHDNYYDGRFTLISDTIGTTPKRQRVGIDTVNNDPTLQLITGIIVNTSATSPNGRLSIHNANTGLGAFEFIQDIPDYLSFQENTFVQYIGAGSARGSNPFSGYISELIIYTGVSPYAPTGSLSNERIELETHIASKFNITMSYLSS